MSAPVPQCFIIFYYIELYALIFCLMHYLDILFIYTSLYDAAYCLPLFALCRRWYIVLLHYYMFTALCPDFIIIIWSQALKIFHRSLLSLQWCRWLNDHDTCLCQHLLLTILASLFTRFTIQCCTRLSRRRDASCRYILRALEECIGTRSLLTST